MTIYDIASIVSSLLFVTAFSFYLASVARGKVRVSVSTFTILAITSFSQVFALAMAGSWYASVYMMIAASINSAVVYFGFKRKNYEIKKLDVMSFTAAIIGIIVWYITNDPALNVYILTCAILISFVPVVRKTFLHPETEDRRAWLLTFLASAMFLLTITSLDPIDWVVQVRQMLFATLMVVGTSRIVK